MRYGKGSNAMSLMQTVLTDGDGPEPRWRTWLKEMWTERRNVLDLYDMKHWSERTVIALVMQTIDNSITVYTKRIPGTRRALPDLPAGPRHPEPDLDPGRQRGGPHDGRDHRRHARAAPIGEPFNRPLTAHFIGGCAIGDSAETGVIDPYQRVYGHPGLHVVDGSAITANLGVNPSLTITAQAERAMAFWPNKGEADPRPDARRGVPPDRAGRARPRRSSRTTRPGALRLPIVGVSA